MPILHLVVVLVIVFGAIGLAWYLLGTLNMDARIKAVINYVLVIGLIIWMFVWLVPRLVALAG